MEKSINIQEVLDYLPHRYPFLMVDRILELIPGERVLGLKNVTINEPFFQGHFPDQAIMPGVLIVEALGQAGGILAYESMPEIRRGTLFYFMGMDRVRFRKPVIPGDQLILELKMMKMRSKAMKMSGVARVDENVVAQAELMAMIGVDI